MDALPTNFRLGPNIFCQSCSQNSVPECCQPELDAGSSHVWLQSSWEIPDQLRSASSIGLRPHVRRGRPAVALFTHRNALIVGSPPACLYPRGEDLWTYSGSRSVPRRSTAWCATVGVSGVPAPWSVPHGGGLRATTAMPLFNPVLAVPRPGSTVHRVTQRWHACILSCDWH